MPFVVLRFNQVQPGLDPQEMSARYRATIEMAAYADEHGMSMVSLEEHHGAEDGWSPSPLVTAAAVLGRTKRLGVTISALLVPLHDPVRLAEDIAVIDLLSEGRLTIVAGLGYRPSEYAAHGKRWEDRGALMDEALDVMLRAWTGEPFEYRGTTVRVTPTPFTRPHPTVLVGGFAKVGARRAARLGLPFHPGANDPELEAYYHEQCALHGTRGFVVMPPPDTSLVFVSEDPDRTWRELGHHFLHEATTYADWQPPGQRSAAHSDARTVEALRAEGTYVVLTPEECVARGPGAVFALHPLVGGMPIDEGWRCVTLVAEQVLPALG